MGQPDSAFAAWATADACARGVASEREHHSYLAGPDRWETFPAELLVAAVNGSSEARSYLETYMDGRADGAVAEDWSDALSRLRQLDELRREP